MFANILVAIDDGAPSAVALDRAAALAAQEHARLTVVHALDVRHAIAQMQMASASLYEQRLAAMRKQADGLLARACAAAAAQGAQATPLLIEAGTTGVADAILHELSRGYDLLAMGTHGRRGVDHLMLGSEAEQVVRRSPVPVLLTRVAAAQAHGSA